MNFHGLHKKRVLPSCATRALTKRYKRYMTVMRCCDLEACSSTQLKMMGSWLKRFFSGWIVIKPEILVERCRLQSAIEAMSPQLLTSKLILLSMTATLTASRSRMEMSWIIVEEAVEVTAQISRLVEALKESSQLQSNIRQLDEILRNTQTYHESKKRSIFRSKKGSSAQYSILKASLTSILENFELFEDREVAQKNERSNHNTHLTNQTQTVTKNIQEGNIFTSMNEPSSFSGAHDFIICGGTFLNVRGNHTSISDINDAKRDLKGVNEGLRVLTREDLFLEREIYKGRGYRLHSAKNSGKILAVKAYEGHRAMERFMEDLKFHQNFFHPNVAQVIAVSADGSKNPFLAFDGDYEGPAEYLLGQVLKTGLQQSLILGLQTVSDLASGLDYLQDNLSLMPALEHFLLLSRKGKIVISFDSGKLVGPYSNIVTALNVFNGLCQKTFDAACQVHYESEVKRAFIDELEANIIEDDDLEDDPRQELDNTRLADGSRSDARTIPPATSTKPFPQRLSRKSQANGRRQELVWKPQEADPSRGISLNKVSCEFQRFLNVNASSFELALNRRRGRYTSRTPHRCPGYNRIEITLTPDITRSAIIFHSSTSPHEICPVCNEVVREAEIFNCICGKDDESMPTVRCSICSEWHHRPCVAFFDSDPGKFVCLCCKGSSSLEQKMEFPEKTEQLRTNKVNMEDLSLNDIQLSVMGPHASRQNQRSIEEQTSSDLSSSTPSTSTLPTAPWTQLQSRASQADPDRSMFTANADSAQGATMTAMKWTFLSTAEDDGKLHQWKNDEPFSLNSHNLGPQVIHRSVSNISVPGIEISTPSSYTSSFSSPRTVIDPVLLTPESAAPKSLPQSTPESSSLGLYFSQSSSMSISGDDQRISMILPDNQLPPGFVPLSPIPGMKNLDPYPSSFVPSTSKLKHEYPGGQLPSNFSYEIGTSEHPQSTAEASLLGLYLNQWKNDGPLSPDSHSPKPQFIHRQASNISIPGIEISTPSSHTSSFSSPKTVIDPVLLTPESASSTSLPQSTTEAPNLGLYSSQSPSMPISDDDQRISMIVPDNQLPPGFIPLSPIAELKNFDSYPFGFAPSTSKLQDETDAGTGDV